MTYYAGNNAPRDPRTIAAYAEAGVTWWLETEAASLTAARERIRRGPPRAV